MLILLVLLAGSRSIKLFWKHLYFGQKWDFCDAIEKIHNHNGFNKLKIVYVLQSWHNLSYILLA